MIMQLNNAITLSTLEMLSMWSVITSNAWMSIKQSIPRGLSVRTVRKKSVSVSTIGRFSIIARFNTATTIVKLSTVTNASRNVALLQYTSKHCTVSVTSVSSSG